MKIYAPKYYKSFKCIADKCSHSCCIGWEIDVDGKTLEKYKSLKAEYAKDIENSIEYSGAPHFKLAVGDRCPHLNDCGLCRIIIEVGEDYLCDICREHPRFYNDVAIGKTVGLGLSCEEAARIILSSDSYAELEEVEENDDADTVADFDALPYIEKIFSILADRTVGYNERLAQISALGGYVRSVLDDVRARELFSELEYLDESDRALFVQYETVTPKPEFEPMLERALAYFVYRHLPKACDKQELLAYLGFALLCERLLAFLSVKTNADSKKGIVALARIVSEEIEYSEDNTYLICSEFYQID